MGFIQWIILCVMAVVLVIIRTTYRYKLNPTLGLIMSLMYFGVVTYGCEHILNSSFIVGVMVAAISYTAIALFTKHFTKDPDNLQHNK